MLKVPKRHLKIEKFIKVKKHPWLLNTNTPISQVVPELWIIEDCKIVLGKYICSVHTLFSCHTLMEQLHEPNTSQ